MEWFECPTIEQFTQNYVIPIRKRLSERREAFENHIVTFNDRQRGVHFYLCSALAVKEMGALALNNQLIDSHKAMEILTSMETHRDTSFFMDFKSPNRSLREGDKVKILVPNPDVIYPATAMIPYLNQQGVVVIVKENGNCEVLLSTNIPAAEFKPSSLQRVSDDTEL
jgi:hypothetical protein